MHGIGGKVRKKSIIPIFSVLVLISRDPHHLKHPPLHGVEEVAVESPVPFFDGGDTSRNHLARFD